MFAIGNRQDKFFLPTYTFVRWVRVHPFGSLLGGSMAAFFPHGIARATVRATTLTPAFRKALKHASSVAPVVNTSSTSKTRRLSTRRPWRPWRVVYTPRTLRHRSLTGSRSLSGRGRLRSNRKEPQGNPKDRASGPAISSAWL